MKLQYIAFAVIVLAAVLPVVRSVYRQRDDSGRDSDRGFDCVCDDESENPPI